MITWHWLIVSAFASSGVTALAAAWLLWRSRCRARMAGGFWHGGSHYLVEPEPESFINTEVYYGAWSWRGPGSERARWP